MIGGGGADGKSNETWGSMTIADLPGLEDILAEHIRVERHPFLQRWLESGDVVQRGWLMEACPRDLAGVRHQAFNLNCPAVGVTMSPAHAPTIDSVLVCCQITQAQPILEGSVANMVTSWAGEQSPSTPAPVG